jgi:hypothetical protein
LLLVGVLVFVLCGFILYGALKMMRLEAYRAALAASVLAMAVSPGNIIGFPLGIWALVVLRRRSVRAAFESIRSHPHSASALHDVDHPSAGGTAIQLPPRPRTELWKIGVAVLAFTLAFLLLASLVAMVASITLPALVRARHQAPQDAIQAPAETWRQFTTADQTISRDITTTPEKSWHIEASEARTVRLFEVGFPFENGFVVYRASIRTEQLEKGAYLEMWCRFPGRGEFFSRALDQVVSGSSDWTSCEARFVLKKGERPDLIRLNLAVNGPGQVWVRDVELAFVSH